MPVSLLSINTASKKAMPLNFSKRIIIYTTDTRETYILNLSKVQHLLNCNINIFKAKKLLNRGDIQIKNKNLIVNKKGLSIFQFNKNILIIKVLCIYIFLIVTQKELLKILIQL